MKKRLSTDDLVTFAAIVDHCGRKIVVGKSQLTEYTEITCPECDEPIMFRGSNGLWYTSGGRIFP